MPTNLAIDDRLLEKAQRVGRHRAKRETVTVALQEYIERRKQQEILALFGEIDYERGYDYKRERKARANLGWKLFEQSVRPFPYNHRTCH